MQIIPIYMRRLTGKTSTAVAILKGFKAQGLKATILTARHDYHQDLIQRWKLDRFDVHGPASLKRWPGEPYDVIIVDDAELVVDVWDSIMPDRFIAYLKDLSPENPHGKAFLLTTSFS